MKLETERLTLVALSPRELYQLVYALPELEKELSCVYRAEPIEGVFREIVMGQLRPTEEDAENYMWHTFWLIIRREDGVVVGSSDFKDVPDENGEVEIGYGLGAGFEKHGYMTECVRAMCDWALEQPGVKAVIAETEPDNTSSQHILERRGFHEYKKAPGMWWRLDRD